jgi:hypothetical protein
MAITVSIQIPICGEEESMFSLFRLKVSNIFMKLTHNSGTDKKHYFVIGAGGKIKNWEDNVQRAVVIVPDQND